MLDQAGRPSDRFARYYDQASGSAIRFVAIDCACVAPGAREPLIERRLPQLGGREVLLELERPGQIGIDVSNP